MVKRKFLQSISFGELTLS